MTTQELILTHPKSVEVVKKWIQNQMIEAFSGDSFTLDLSPIEDEYLITIIEKGPRALFDVFDDNNLFISIMRNTHNKFTYQLGTPSAFKEGKNCETRKEAENKSVIEAFKILEEQL